MSMLTTALRWKRAAQTKNDDRALAHKRLADWDRQKPIGIDASQYRDWLKRRQELELDAQAADEAHAVAEREAARAAEAEKIEQEEEAYRAAERQAKADESIVRQLAKLDVQRAQATARLAASKAATAAANKVRGSRPPILDAEQRLRTIPGREIPATFENEEVWVNAQGQRPVEYVLRGGEMVPAYYREYKKTTQRVQKTTAKTIPSRMPKSYVETEIVDMKGERLWPEK